MDKLWYVQEKKRYFLSFLRLRDTNIPTKARIDKESEPMVLEDDEYIGEEACALYDGNVGALMLQRNRHSLSVAGIEEYLNLLWQSTTEKIYLRPIMAYDVTSRVRGAQEYRRMTIRFADIQDKEFFEEEKKPILDILKGLKKYNAVNAEVTITMGHTRNESLSKETVVQTIDTALGHRELISKAEIGIKETDDTNVEILDLFDNKLHNFIFVSLERRESLASEYVETVMNEKFDETMAVILASVRS